MFSRIRTHIDSLRTPLSERADTPRQKIALIGFAIAVLAIIGRVGLGSSTPPAPSSAPAAPSPAPRSEVAATTAHAPPVARATVAAHDSISAESVRAVQTLGRYDEEITTLEVRLIVQPNPEPVRRALQSKLAALREARKADLALLAHLHCSDCSGAAR